MEEAENGGGQLQAKECSRTTSRPPEMKKRRAGRTPLQGGGSGCGPASLSVLAFQPLELCEGPLQAF